MIKVTLKGRDLRVAFRYDRDENNNPIHTKAVIDQKQADDSWETISSGYAFLSKKDKFCYKLGRSIALGRAIKEQFNKDEQKVLRTVLAPWLM